MSYETAHNTIRTHFGTQIEDAQSVYVLYDNVEDGHPADTKWVRMSILDGEAFQSEIGASPKFRHPGIMEVQVFVPVHEGDKTALTLADQIVTAFRRTTISGSVVFRTPSVLTVGSTGGKWWQVNVTCPFYFTV